MDSKSAIYEVEFTEDCRDEIRDIYEYISKNLIAEESAKNLMKKLKESIYNLAETPEIYMKIEKKDKFKRQFRRMVINNYIVLYTIDENLRKVFISHMYYSKKNYLI